MTLALHPDMVEGARLFDASRFWDAHEAWERVWIAEKDADRRRLVQGLIQLAAALHKLLAMKNSANAEALARRARTKLEGLPDRFEGFDVIALRAAIDACAGEMARAGDPARFDPGVIPRLSVR